MSSWAEGLQQLLEEGYIDSVAHDKLSTLLMLTHQDSWQEGYEACFSRIRDVMKVMS